MPRALAAAPTRRSAQSPLKADMSRPRAAPVRPVSAAAATAEPSWFRAAPLSPVPAPPRRRTSALAAPSSSPAAQSTRCSTKSLPPPQMQLLPPSILSISMSERRVPEWRRSPSTNRLSPTVRPTSIPTLTGSCAYGSPTDVISSTSGWRAARRNAGSQISMARTPSPSAMRHTMSASP